MELRFAPLFSGSSGNSIYVGCDSGHLLVDAGVSCARVVAELRRLGVDPARLAGILVTHEHIDHIRGVGVLSLRYDLPVYATEGTWTAMEDKLGGVALKNARVHEPLRDLYVGGMNVMAFDIPHDAAQPVGYAISAGGARLSVATDIGCVRESWLNVAAGSEYAWPMYSLEGIVAADPDVILISDYGDGTVVEQFCTLSGYGELRAVQEGHVYALTDDLISRPGPRIAEGFQQVVDALADAGAYD